jgi:PIN domain nuclease of toxin-antitoxin system
MIPRAAASRYTRLALVGGGRRSALPADQGFLELPIRIDHGQAAGALPGPHRDPFDRMLIAQAARENLILVSNETAFDAYGIKRLW